MISKIIKVIKSPRKVLIYLASLGLIKYDDKKYIEYVYQEKMHKRLDLENPKTFNEKLQWLKLHDKNSLYTTLVDKEKVKYYIKEVLSEDYVIPLLGVYEKVEDIDFDKLPDKFVLKTTHDSGTYIICDNKKEFDKEKAIKKLKKRLKRKYFYLWREWPYKNVKPKVIAEKYVADKDNQLNDYKFYCFNGKSDYVMVCTDRRTTKPKFYYFNRQWQLQRNMSSDGMETEEDFYLEKPINLEKMFNIAEKLSKDFTFVRLDLYNVDGKIYFGEFTFYPSAGFDNTRLEYCENIFSNKLEINKE